MKALQLERYREELRRKADLGVDPRNTASLHHIAWDRGQRLASLGLHDLVRNRQLRSEVDANLALFNSRPRLQAG